MAFGDRLRPEAVEVIRALRARGVHTFLLSGDAQATTERLARAAGVDEFRGEVPPAGKSAVVKHFQDQGRVVAMVGDGINDAPALAAADIGIALGSGADLARHTAPVVLMSESLHRIPETFALAHRTLRVVKQNLFWAFAYNAAGVPLAAGILFPFTGLVLSPMIASAAMSFSSVTVISNALRLRRARL
jgi:Cu+-exporting ATPase